MTTLAEIENAARRYSEAREDLGDVVRGLMAQIEALKRAQLKAIRRRVQAAAAAHAQLAQAIEAAPHLFEKPRTQILHGVKVGFVKGKGRLEWADADQVVRLIERHCSEEQVDILVRTQRSPVAAALAKLPANELKRLGVTVVDAGDELVIKPVDGEIDKLVDALLKDAQDEAHA